MAKQMSATELRKLLKVLNFALSDAPNDTGVTTLARLVDVHLWTAKAWVAERNGIPGPVATLLRLMAATGIDAGKALKILGKEGG